MSKMLILVAIASVSIAASAADVDRTVFNIELGKPLTLHECPKRKSSGGTLEFYLQSSEISEQCFSQSKKGALPNLQIPDKEQPRILNARFEPYLTIIDGNVEGIDFKTYGVDREEDTFGLLTSKYGMPARMTTGIARNMAGAQFTTRDANWVFNNLSVTYHSTEGNLTFGRVIVETDRAKALRDATQTADDAKRQKF